MIVLDFSIVSIAMPAIQAELHFDPGDVQWVISAYTIIFAGFLLIAGRLSDLFGRRLVFICGLAIFVLTSGVAGFAHSPSFLVAMRALQGLGAAMVNPAALALVTDLFEEGPVRNKALGLWGVIGSAGLTGGILLGGILTSALGWRSVFFVNVPIGIALIALTPLFVNRDTPAAVQRRIDYFGALLLTAGMLLFVYTIEEMSEDGLTSVATLLRFGASIVLFSAFVWVERRVSDPVLPLGSFKLPNLAPATFAVLFQAAAYATLFVYSSLYFQTELHWPPWKAAIAFLPMSVLLTAFAGPYSAPLATRFGARTIALAAGLLMVAGAVIMSVIDPGTPYILGALPGTVIAGFGDMLTYQMAMMIGLAHIPKQETGAASGLISTGVQVGLSLGVAIGGTVVETSLGIRGAFYAAIALSVITWIMFLTVRNAGAAAPGARHHIFHHPLQA